MDSDIETYGRITILIPSLQDVVRTHIHAYIYIYSYMQIDLSRMPLGALSRQQILKGYQDLTELQNIITDEVLNRIAKHAH
jgi:hypothetical protein